MLKSFNYTQQFTMAELDKFGDDRVKKIQEIMINGLLESMAKSNSLAMESKYDLLSNTVQVTISVVNNQSITERKPVDLPSYQEIKPFVFDTLKDAETIVDALLNLYEKYGFVTKAELYGLVGVVDCFADMKYGWKDLNGISIRRTRGNPSKYEINLPRPQPLN